MNYSINQLFCFVLFLLSFDAFHSAPTKKSNTVTFKQCKQSDPQFLKCFSTELQNAIPQLAEGYPKFRIPPIEPFDLTSLDIAKGEGAVAVDIKLHNIKIHGLTSAKISSLTLDVDKLQATGKVTFTKPINIVGQYTAKGKVQVLPINGKGACNITLVDPVFELKNINADTYEKNGATYIQLKKVVMNIVGMSKVLIKMENLMQGNKELSENLNYFLNENWQLILDELKPAIEEAISVIVMDIANKSLDKVPKNEIFPK